MGTDTQKLIDLLETMFGDLDPKEVDPEQLESETTKILRRKVAKAEETAAAVIHGPILADQITRVPITTASLPAEFGIPPESLPETEGVREASSRNPTKRVTKFYYTCKICQHSSQNKVSMLTHTHRHLKIKLFCQICNKEYESADYMEKHINEAHEGKYVMVLPMEAK